MSKLATTFAFVLSLTTAQLLLPTPLAAQQYPIVYYSRDRGLPGNQVWAIFQDSKGYMWFAVDGSLIRYNGTEYKRFGEQDGLTEGLVVGITEDRSGNMWFAHDRGVGTLSNGTVKSWTLSQSEDRYGVFADSYGRVWAYKTAFPGDMFLFERDSVENFSERHSFKNQAVLSMVEDNEGGICVLTRSAKIFRLLGSEIKEITPRILREKRPRGCFLDANNNLVVYMREGVVSCPGQRLEDEKAWSWLLRVPTQYGVTSRRGFYWFSTDNEGLIRLTTQTGASKDAILRISGRNGLDFHNMYALFEDTEGDLWIGDDVNGVAKIPSLAFATFGKGEGLSDDAIVSSARMDKTMFLGTEKGLYTFDGRTYHKMGNIDPPTNRMVLSLLPLPSRTLLIGSVPGLFSYEATKGITKVGFDKHVIQAMVRSPNGEIWLGTHKGLFRLRNEHQTYLSDPLMANSSIKQIAAYRHVDMVVRDDKEIYIVENALSSVRPRVHPIARGEQLMTAELGSFTIDVEGNLIISTDQGVYIVDTLGQWQPIRGPGATRRVAFADTKRRLWIGEDRTLYRYEQVDGAYQLATSYARSAASFMTVSEAGDAKMYFGSRGGLTVYDPDEEPSVMTLPACNITALFVNDSIVAKPQDGPAELASGGRISIMCEGLTFYNEDATRFEYYLSPIEKPWSRSSMSPSIDLGYMEPNEYSFFVRAVTPLGITSDSAAFSFVVLAPVWKRPWSVGIMVLIFCIAGYGAHRIRQSQVRRRNVVLERAVTEKTKALEESKSQIESQYHQLLNAQEELVGKKELERAYEEIQLLKNRLDTENIYLKEKQGRVEEVGSVIGRSRAIQEVREKILDVAPTESTVLLMGETGVGKNLVAEAIHGLSSRKSRALVTVNCAAIPDSLVESELFGHEKGAFTGASACRIGKFEVADGSTIFLDEIGDMNLAVQAKILNVLQSRQFSRVGGNSNKAVDVRVIAATNHNLDELVRKGRFRQDLLYRINVYVIDIPPLRERTQDIELLAKFFIDRYAKTLNKRIHAVTKSALDVLEGYPYPGNIRELENIIHRSVIICKGETISDQDILVNAQSLSKGVLNNGERDSFVTLEGMEKRHILRALEQANWKISGPSGAAERLGLHHNTLRNRMQKLGIPFHPEENGSKPLE